MLAVPDCRRHFAHRQRRGPDVSLLSIDASLAAASLLPGGRPARASARRDRRRTVLHVEGNEGVHSGGTGGGFSFADRAVGGFVDAAGAGERWVWYASGGTARLWSGRDLLTIGTTGEGLGLDVARRMRVRQGGDALGRALVLPGRHRLGPRLHRHGERRPGRLLRRRGRAGA